MNGFFGAIGKTVWTGAFAVVSTAVIGGIWTALLLANLKASPSIPWAAGVMALILGAVWSWLGGKWGPRRTAQARNTYLRATSISGGMFTVALTAGVLCIAALSGLWIVLFQLVEMPGNSAPDFSHFPIPMVLSTLVMAALVGAVSEEAGYRGYFQGTLERYLPGPVAILIASLVMAPEHAVTQGFVWPVLLFYLLVDWMLGFCAYVTRSILPGVAIHAIGLLTFFALVWPHDHERAMVWQRGADEWFWIHAGQAIGFGALGITVFVRLARMARSRNAISFPAALAAA